MSINQALPSDLNIIKNICETTISEIYPHYYPKGAVEFFLKHHSQANIANDIKENNVFLCLAPKQTIVGTITIKANEICRLFVLPQYQKNGYGSEMLDYAERTISRQYSEITLAASLPAKAIYQKRGYKDSAFHTILTDYNDYLCYDIMTKQCK